MTFHDIFQEFPRLFLDLCACSWTACQSIITEQLSYIYLATTKVKYKLQNPGMVASPWLVTVYVTQPKALHKSEPPVHRN